MASGYKLFWTHEALTKLNQIIEYLETNWTDKEISNFVKSLDHRLKLVATRPLAFPASIKYKDVRRTVLDKKTTIYYQHDEQSQTIIILSLWGNQNPDNLKL